MTFNNNICNHCGSPIKWRTSQGKAIIHEKTGRAQPLNADDSLHLCMTKGQKDYFKPTPYGSKIYDW